MRDFVLVDSGTFAPRLVVELDDRSHDRADRRERDAFVDDVLAAAGIPILHVRWQRSHDTQTLAEQIAATLGLASPAIVSPVAATLVVTPPQPAESFCAPIAPVDATVAAATPAPASHASAVPVRAPVGANLADAPPAPMRRLCGHCQADLREAAKFCSNRGAVFSA